MIKVIAAIVLAYLIGSISPAILISRALGKDIRELGSGNAGTTNMLRNYGKKLAAVTLVIDALKGALAVILGRYLAGEPGACWSVLAVIAGHNWPIYFGFKGGKGIASSLGALLALSPCLALIATGAALLIMALTKMVSAGSIVGGILVPVLSFFMKKEFFYFGLVLAIVIVFKHRSNIKRILNGTESKLDFSKYKS